MKHLGRLVALAALAIPIAATPAPAAHAAVLYNCSISSFSGTLFGSKCDSVNWLRIGLGLQRGWVKCIKPGSVSYWKAGPPVGPGIWSFAQCVNGYRMDFTSGYVQVV